MLAVLSDLDWWVAGVSNLAKDIQPHLSQDENLQLAGVYSQRYLLESCRSMEELEIQVTSLFSQFKLRERDGYLSRLSPHVPLATRRDLRVSPLVGGYLFDEVLVSQAGDRLQGDVSPLRFQGQETTYPKRSLKWSFLNQSVQELRNKGASQLHSPRAFTADCSLFARQRGSGGRS